MKTKILRALPVTVAVVVIAAIAAFGAFTAGAPSEPALASAAQQQDGDGIAAAVAGSPGPVPAAGDDDGTADRGSGDAPGTAGAPPAASAPQAAPAPPAAPAPQAPPAADGSRPSPSEDRPLRSEHRSDGDRGESRVEVRHTGTQTYSAADAGAVTITRSDDRLTISAVQPSGGWTARVERSSGSEVEVTFRSGDRRVDFDAEVEGDRVKVRVRDRER